MTQLPSPSRCRDAADVIALLEACFGRDPATDRGVLHSAAVWESPNGPRVLRIGEHAPASELDFFLLHVARARATAIVTTGRILRDEPNLRYDLGIGAGFAPALEAYRRERVGLTARPRLVVLSRGSDLPFTHPALHGFAKPVIFVPEEAPGSLEAVAEMHAVELRRFASLDLDVALDALRDDGEHTVAIEAGVATTAERYARGSGFDELVLGRYLGHALDARAIGDAFPDRDRLERYYGPPVGEVRVDEPSGPWSFARYRRAR